MSGIVLVAGWLFSQSLWIIINDLYTLKEFLIVFIIGLKIYDHHFKHLNHMFNLK